MSLSAGYEGTLDVIKQLWNFSTSKLELSDLPR